MTQNEEDCYIVSREDYQKYKSYQQTNKSLLKQINTLGKEIQKSGQRYDILQQKLINRNGDLTKEKLKVQCLQLILKELKSEINYKGQGLKEFYIQSSRFSVIRIQQSDPDEQLPQGFSKSDIYQQTIQQLSTERQFIQYVANQFNQKDKTIQYFQNQIKNSGGLHSYKIQNEQKIRNLEIQNKQLKEKNTIFQAKSLLNNGSRQKLTKYEAEIQNNKVQIQNYKAEIQNQKQKNSDLTKNNAELQKKVSILYQELNSFQEYQSNLQEKMKSNTNEAQKVRLQTEQTIKQLRRQLAYYQKEAKEHKNVQRQPKIDTYGKMMSIISEYCIQLKRQFKNMGLTSNQTKQLIQNYCKQIQKMIKQQLQK